MKKTLITMLATLALTLALAGAALAQSSTEGGYNPPDDEIINKIDSGTPRSTAPSSNKSSSSELPFTGLDLGLLGGAGTMLLGMGVGMRRLTRAPESA